MVETLAHAAAPTQPAPTLVNAPPARGLVRDAFRKMRRNPGAMVGLVVLTLMILSALLAPLIAPHDPIVQNSQAIRKPPSLHHLFGTDTFGRDVFSRVLYGGRNSLPVGLIAVGIAALARVLGGSTAG